MFQIEISNKIWFCLSVKYLYKGLLVFMNLCTNHVNIVFYKPWLEIKLFSMNLLIKMPYFYSTTYVIQLFSKYSNEPSLFFKVVFVFNSLALASFLLYFLLCINSPQFFLPSSPSATLQCYNSCFCFCF